MAVCISLARCLYLHARKLCEIRWPQVYHPCAHVAMRSWPVLLHPDEMNTSSKTGRFSDTLAIVGQIGERLASVILRGKRAHGPNDFVLPISQTALTQYFALAVVELSLQAL